MNPSLMEQLPAETLRLRFAELRARVTVEFLAIRGQHFLCARAEST